MRETISKIAVLLLLVSGIEFLLRPIWSYLFQDILPKEAYIVSLWFISCFILHCFIASGKIKI